MYRYAEHTTYLLLYVDNIILICSSMALLQQIMSLLNKDFVATDVGPLNYFLRISITRDFSSVFLFQEKYAIEILKRANMMN